jgi:hypothetical protein
MGCLRSIGCLTVFLVVGGAAYVTRDTWMHRLSPDTAGAGWAPITTRGAATARRAVESLATPRGPAYVDVAGADFAAYVLHGVVPASAEAAVIDDKLHVRSRVDLRSYASIPRIVGDSQVVELIGTIDVPHPGVGAFRATEIKVGDVPLPPVLISRIFHGADSATVGLPTAVGDIRVARGHITLYKKTP